MTSTVNITVTPGREYWVTLPAGVNASYNGEAITNYFIAIEGVSTLTLTSNNVASGSITVSEILRNFYEAYDGYGGVWSFQPNIDKWTSLYSYRPEWMNVVGNRLVTFKNGYPYVHNSSTYNQFYGVNYDSVVAFVHNDAGDLTKVYESISIEGDTPDIVHVRTEVPDVQSSDIRGGALNRQTMQAGDFRVNEGVNYSAILRDRLSPNSAGTADQKLYKGDPMRGEFGLFQGVFSTPSTQKVLKFANIGFIPSRGHNTQNS